MAKSKLFADWSWRLAMPSVFADPSVEVRRDDVYSRYNSTAKKSSTLHAPTLQALMAYAALVVAEEDGKPVDGLGAIGNQGEKTIVAEYPGSSVECVVFTRANARFTAGIIRTMGAAPGVYTLGESASDGSALFFALMPLLLEDEEFAEACKECCDAARDGYSDLDAASRTASLLCDNVYRRIENHASLGKDGVKVSVSPTGNLSQLTEMAMEQNVYAPSTILHGEFRVFEPGAAPGSVSVMIPHASFVGQYRMSDRTLSSAEQALVPVLPDWYVIPKEVERACQHIAKTTGSQNPMRNIMFRGPAGTGKTEGAKAIAAGLGLPYMFLTCSANTEVFDMLGQVLPKMESDCSAASGELPTIMDIQMDPATAYAQMTGEYREDVTEDEVLRKMIEVKAHELGENKDPQNGFYYVETSLVKAMRHGYLIEIQEPTVIANPGVLVGLNSLLDRCASITLPNGERVERHPETVVVVTTNTSYEGCKDLNQSVISRMNLTIDIDEPDLKTTVDRVMGITACSDKGMVEKMAEVVQSINQRCRETMITDGSCGVRELISWVQSAMILGSPYESALYTVISSASADPENREELINTCLEPIFARR